MSTISTESPLRAGELEGAAHLCLEKAALANLDDFPPGVANLNRRHFHDMRRRFEEAKERTDRGVTSIVELGLLVEDLSWAARPEQARRAKDRRGWEDHFRTAEKRLRAALPWET